MNAAPTEYFRLDPFGPQWDDQARFHPLDAPIKHKSLPGVNGLLVGLGLATLCGCVFSTHEPPKSEAQPVGSPLETVTPPAPTPPPPEIPSWSWCGHTDAATQRGMEALMAATGVKTCGDVPEAVNRSTSLDLSHQNLEHIRFLEEFVHLTRLNLSHNKHTNVYALESLTRLEHLDVSHNKLDSLYSIADLPLKTLKLDGNPGDVTEFIANVPHHGPLFARPTDAFLSHCRRSQSLNFAAFPNWESCWRWGCWFAL